MRSSDPSNGLWGHLIREFPLSDYAFVLQLNETLAFIDEATFDLVGVILNIPPKELWDLNILNVLNHIMISHLFLYLILQDFHKLNKD